MTSLQLALVATVASVVLVACSATPAHGDLSAKVQAFDQYPIVWLGPAYDADGDGSLDLITAVRTNVSPAFYHPRTGALIKPEIRSFSISYGTCEIPDGASACPIPLQLDFSAACDTFPLSDMAKVATIPIRGVQGVVQINGALRLETADFTLTVSPIGVSDEEITRKAIAIANDLVPANAKARSSVSGANFRAKTPNLCADGSATPTAAVGSSSPTASTIDSATVTPIPPPR